MPSPHYTEGLAEDSSAPQHSAPSTQHLAGPLATLRRFARRPKAAEKCELCGAELSPEHEHLLELANRQLHCACQACGVLFSDARSGRFRRVPQRIELWSDFRMSDEQWEELHIPINLAFMFHSTAAGRVMAMYPGPAGATESLLTLEGWANLVQENPALRELEPDVEALLVYRIGPNRDYWRVPIDECFKLVGIIRTHWRGLSGGTEVWREIGRFFERLKARSGHGGAHG